MKKICLSILLLCIAVVAFAQVKVQNLTVESRVNPVGVDSRTPRFSWQITSDVRNMIQTAYEVAVTDEAGKPFWTSGMVNSEQSVLVPYGGTPLASGTKYSWKVRVWDNNNKPTAWSAQGTWQMGLLDKSDWKAKWISPVQEDTVTKPSPLFRKT